jgi:AP-2 complex subunit alpha
MYRLTVRATDESVPPVLLKLMEDRLSHGHEVESVDSVSDLADD